MNKSLIIVESPAKAKTIKKFLTSGYEVKASMGHVRDLPKSTLGVDVKNQFKPKYVIIKGKNALIKELKEAVKSSKQVYLATDPDREGEAIAWHLSEILGLDKKAKRIELREITKNALKEALAHAKSLDLDKVNAQQARRVLDRLVGYKLSPLLWKKVKGGLSAGRVQSVAVKLICDREKEIQAFVPQEYWTLTAYFLKDEVHFPASLFKVKDEKIELSNKTQVEEILKALEGENYRVSSIVQKEQKRNPPPPFITSTLQQEASGKLGFKVTRTMSIAQQLYEGLEIGEEGATGLITYMRTDSTRISEAAQDEAHEFILKNFSDAYWSGRQFKVKETAQDAHEAIRPTRVFRTPESVKPYLNKDQFRLYKLIWERFLASQMSPAIFDRKTVEIQAGDYTFKATGSTLKFNGYLALYEESHEEDEEKINLPPLTEGEILSLEKLEPKQHFTQPPPRYTEASLVKTLEEKGIGRPSTYAPIIETILQRHYVTLENKHFIPTQLGFLVTDILEKNFSEILNVDFTAAMESKLDAVEEGKLDWISLLSEFYPSFEGAVQNASENLERVKLEPETLSEACPNCGKPLVIREGRFGRFVACSGYPDCRYTRAFSKGIGVACPKCGSEIVELRTKKGKPFFGCSNFPQCDFKSWNKPTPEKCEKCGSMMVLRKVRNGGAFLVCSQESCGYTPTAKKAS
jgi:DNA topoisomerase-1